MSSMAPATSLIHCNRHILNPEEWERIRLSLKLSAREVEVTQHIFDDNKSECIAMILGISVHTINTYLQRLYVKLDVRSRSQLILRIFKDHLEHVAETGNAKMEPYEQRSHSCSVH